MNIFGRPKNKWGRARLAGAVALAGVILWALAAAVLRGMPVPWMAWSGYPHFTLVRGLEAAVIPLGVLVLFRWLEEEEFKAETERIRRREHERSAGMRRGEVLQRFRQAVQAVLPGGDHSLTELPDHDRLAIAGIIRETLPELDGKGKGEMLSFLHARGLLREKTR